MPDPSNQSKTAPEAVTRELYIIDPPAFILRARSASTSSSSSDDSIGSDVIMGPGDSDGDSDGFIDCRAQVIAAAANNDVITIEDDDNEGEEESATTNDINAPNDRDSDSTITDPDITQHLLTTEDKGKGKVIIDNSTPGGSVRPAEWEPSPIAGRIGAAEMSEASSSTINVCELVHPTTIIDPVVDANTAAGTIAVAATNENPLVASIIQEYFLKIFLVIVPLQHIATGPTANAPGYYYWNIRPSHDFRFFFERPSGSWTPGEVAVFKAALGVNITPMWAPKIDLAEDFDVEGYLRNFYNNDPQQRIRPVSFYDWYTMHTGEDLRVDKPCFQSLVKIPGLQIHAIPKSTSTKAYKFAQYNDAIHRHNVDFELLWHSLPARLMLKRKLDYYITGISGVDVGEVRRYQEICNRSMATGKSPLFAPGTSAAGAIPLPHRRNPVGVGESG